MKELNLFTIDTELRLFRFVSENEKLSKQEKQSIEKHYGKINHIQKEIYTVNQIK